MEITHQLNEKDFVEAYRTHCSRGPSRKWRTAIWVLFLVIFIPAIIFHAIATNTSAVSAYLPLAILAIAWFVVIRWFQLFNMRKQFRNQPGVQGPRTMTFDSDGTHLRWDGGSADVAWKNYIRWVEGKNQILFYTSPACFNILPTQGLDAEQIAELRKMLSQNIQTPK